MMYDKPLNLEGSDAGAPGETSTQASKKDSSDRN